MGIDYDKFWGELVKEGQEEYASRNKLDGEMSVKDYATETGLTEKAAKNLLQKKVASGILKRRIAILEGHKTALYSPIITK